MTAQLSCRGYLLSLSKDNLPQDCSSEPFGMHLLFPRSVKHTQVLACQLH